LHFKVEFSSVKRKTASGRHHPAGVATSSGNYPATFAVQTFLVSASYIWKNSNPKTTLEKLGKV